MSEQDTRKQLLNGICGSKSEKTPEIARQDGVLNISDVQDTREQLEADIRAWHRDTPFATKPSVQTLLGWLDRQAAITRAECKNTFVHFAERLQLVQNGYDAAVGDMQAKIAELTAERDKLREAIDAMNNGQFYSMYKAKCEECEQLKKVVRTQAESFKKLECELAGKDG